ncbi:zinc knuckle CX2CX4HX4C containing protein [Tanacetum coccineum]
MEGTFLRYRISPEGIKPCPDKTEAVLRLPFLSKSAKKSLPLFKTLKKCIKKSDFHWTPEAEQAIKQLKQHLSELPMLILADFLVEKSDEAPPNTSVVETPQEPWTLFTDGSSGAGLILTSPEGTEFTYALSIDSKLVANQVLGTYVAKEENMIKYLEKAKSLVSGFANFSISQVPRSKNKKADALSKIASTSFAHLSKQVLVEVLKEKSIQEKEVATVAVISKAVAKHCKDVRDDGNPKVSNSSPLVSLTATINMPRGLCNVDVAATFGVPLTTVGDLHLLIKSIEAGKHDELLSRMTNDERMAIMDALDTICNSIQADNTNADVIPCKVSHVDDLTNLNIDESTMPNDPIVQSVDINTKSTSYAGAAGASAKDQPKVNSNFRHLVADPVFDGDNISIPRKVVEKVSTRFEHTLYGYFIGKRMAFPVVEYYARNNWAKHGLKRIMMNNKGFFFFKFDSQAGLEAIFEGGPWLIRNSPIILKKWSMDTRLLKEELTRIPIWVKLHDVPIQVFEEDGMSSFARCLIEVNSEVDLVDVVTIGIPSLTVDDFIKETICVEYEWRPPICDICKIFGHVQDHCPKKVVSPSIVSTTNVVTPTVEKINDGFQTAGKKKKRKGKSKSTNVGQFAGPSIKPNVRYEPKAITSAPKKGATNEGNASKSPTMSKTTGYSSKNDNIITSNSYSALNEEEDEEEDIENVYDETANLFPNTKTGESSSFTAAAG